MTRSRPLVLAGSMLLAGALSVSGLATAQEMDPTPAEPNPSHATFVAELSGFNEVPGAATLAKGAASYQVAANHSSVYYTITLTDASTAVTAAHIHLGRPGENGPVVVPLCGTPTTPACAGEGLIVQGSFTQEALAGPLASSTLDGLVDQMRQGNTYTNVHSTKFPGGEARGQNWDLSSLLNQLQRTGDRDGDEVPDMTDPDAEMDHSMMGG